MRTILADFPSVQTIRTLSRGMHFAQATAHLAFGLGDGLMQVVEMKGPRGGKPLTARSENFSPWIKAPQKTRTVKSLPPPPQFVFMIG